jgi:acetyl esterase/lipase
VVVVINYRLYPYGNVDDMSDDIIQAICWVVENIHTYNGDADNIRLFGFSAGAHLAATSILRAAEILQHGERCVKGAGNAPTREELTGDVTQTRHYGRSPTKTPEVTTPRHHHHQHGSGTGTSMGMGSGMGGRQRTNSDGTRELEEGVSRLLEPLERDAALHGRMYIPHPTTSSNSHDPPAPRLTRAQTLDSVDAWEIEISRSELPLAMHQTALSHLKAVMVYGGIYHIDNYYKKEARTDVDVAFLHIHGVESISPMAPSMRGRDNFRVYSPHLQVHALEREYIALLPIFVVAHGGADPMVPYDIAFDFFKAMSARGALCKLVTIKNAGHTDGLFHIMAHRVDPMEVADINTSKTCGWMKSFLSGHIFTPEQLTTLRNQAIQDAKMETDGGFQAARAMMRVLMDVFWKADHVTAGTIRGLKRPPIMFSPIISSQPAHPTLMKRGSCFVPDVAEETIFTSPRQPPRKLMSRSLHRSLFKNSISPALPDTAGLLALRRNGTSKSPLKHFVTFSFTTIADEAIEADSCTQADSEKRD